MIIFIQFQQPQRLQSLYLYQKKQNKVMEEHAEAKSQSP